MKPKRYRFYLTGVEKKVLFQKYVLQGMSYEQAHDKVELMIKHLEDFVINLKEKKKLQPKQIHIQFLEEFAKLCEETT